MNKTNKLQQVGESREWRSFNSKKIKTSISNYDQYKNTTKGQKKNPLQILEIKMWIVRVWEEEGVLEGILEERKTPIGCHQSLNLNSVDFF